MGSELDENKFDITIENKKHQLILKERKKSVNNGRLNILQFVKPVTLEYNVDNI